MPGGDGTGPLGYGPMTGRAAGYCAGYPYPGYANPVPGQGRGWFGYGRGRGWFGRGRGFGWRGAYPFYGYPYAEPTVSPQDEKGMLNEQAKALQAEIESINQRLKELETETKKK